MDVQQYPSELELQGPFHQQKDVAGRDIALGSWERRIAEAECGEAGGAKPVQTDGISMEQHVLHHRELERKGKDSLMGVPSPEDKLVEAGSDPDGVV